MTVEILRSRMHDEIEAMLERTLHIGTGECIVGGGPDAALFGDGGDALEVYQLEERIGRRRAPGQPGVRPNLRFDRIRVGEIEIADLDSHRALAPPLEQPARSAIEVV